MAMNSSIMWRMIVNYLNVFECVPRPESIKDDLDRPNKRVKLGRIEYEFDELVEQGYLRGPGKFTGGYQLTEKGWNRYERSAQGVRA